MWRATGQSAQTDYDDEISIHTLRVEGDWSYDYIRSGTDANFNPHPPCGGRRKNTYYLYGANTISIHTLRVEGDDYIDETSSHIEISIHTLRVEGDCAFGSYRRIKGKFQSTPSVWRATTVLHFITALLLNFNPHPPCGGRQQ